MSNPPTFSPAENFAAMLRCITRSVVTQGIIGRLTPALVGLIVDRFRIASQGFARIAALVAAGTWRPRRCGPRRHPVARKFPGRPPVAAKIGWLVPLLPEVAQYRGQLLHLLQQPEMVALIEAAPAAMARALRPICWALRMKPPPILARPRPVAPPAPEPFPTPAPAAPRPAAPSPTAAPARRPAARRRRQTCGPPHPA